MLAWIKLKLANHCFTFSIKLGQDRSGFFYATFLVGRELF